MAQQTATTDGGSKNKHPAAGIETIVVDADDVVAAMKRNDRDQDEQRSHVLRLHPTFEGEVRAKPHVSEAHTYYPPEMSQKPVHLSPAAFLVGHDAGSRHPDFSDEWRHPDYLTEKSLFRDEFDIRGPDGENRQFTEDEQDEWDEWWDTVVNMWEDRVRQRLANTDELTLTSQHPDTADATVAVRLELQD